jgi:hypothetical protein
MPEKKPLWKKKPEEEDYESARRFLSLLYSKGDTRKHLRALLQAPSVEYVAKDLLRASGLPLLLREEPHVNEDLRKIHKRKPLAPVLLVQGDMSQGIALLVADGYHRICAVCYYDEDTPIRCRLARA